MVMVGLCVSMDDSYFIPLRKGSICHLREYLNNARLCCIVVTGFLSSDILTTPGLR